ncbi:MAG: hypothetical protein QMD22_10460, partial [archaeon]|nr:hypothetical protein [archaeon]
GANPKLGVCIPNLCRVSVEWAIELSRLSKTIGVPFKYYLNKHFRIDTARNRLVRDAISDGCEHILFLDTDIYPSTYNGKEFLSFPHALFRLWSHHYPISTGVYQTKLGYSNMFMLVDAEDRRPFAAARIDLAEIHDKVFYVDACGLGFTLFDTRVFDLVDFPWFEYRYDEKGWELSEDLSFFLKLYKQTGVRFRVLADGVIICLHEAAMLLRLDGKSSLLKL